MPGSSEPCLHWGLSPWVVVTFPPLSLSLHQHPTLLLHSLGSIRSPCCSDGDLLLATSSLQQNTEPEST